MKALSVRQPWAWLILNAGKDIENRDWPTRMRGRVLVHTGKGMTRDEYDGAAELLADITYARGTAIQLPEFNALERGGIVGSIEIVGCVEDHDSPWFFGDYGFVLRDPIILPFRPFRGELGFFNVPDAVESGDQRHD